MLDLLLLILLVWAFVRFYKKLGTSGKKFQPGMHNPASGRNAKANFYSGKRPRSFDDIEEADYIEVREKEPESSASKG